MIVCSIILFSVSFIFLGTGIMLLQNSERAAHGTHHLNISPGEYPKFYRALAKGLLAIGGVLFLGAALLYLGRDPVVLEASLFTVCGGVAVAVIMMCNVVRDYNGRIF